MRKTSLFFPNSGTTATSNPSANSWKKHWKTWKINSFSWQQLLIVSFHNFPPFPGGIFPLNLAFPTRLCACTPRMTKNSLVQTVLEQHSQGNVPVLPIPYQNPRCSPVGYPMEFSPGAFSSCIPVLILCNRLGKGSNSQAFDSPECGSCKPQADPSGKRECEGWISSLWSPL